MSEQTQTVIEKIDGLLAEARKLIDENADLLEEADRGYLVVTVSEADGKGCTADHSVVMGQRELSAVVCNLFLTLDGLFPATMHMFRKASVSQGAEYSFAVSKGGEA